MSCNRCRRLTTATLYCWVDGAKCGVSLLEAGRLLCYRDGPCPKVGSDPMIPFTCPHCGRQTDVDDWYAGQTARENRGFTWMLFSLRGRIPRRIFRGATLIRYIVLGAGVVLLSLTFGEEEESDVVGMGQALGFSSSCYSRFGLKWLCRLNAGTTAANRVRGS